MLAAVVDLLACPLCGEPLTETYGALRCPQAHSFDLARQGYVTLFGGGGSKVAGDSAAMVAARDRLLSAGHYAPLTAALVEAATRAPDGPILDLGAGTGHHLAAMLDAAPGRIGVAVDASKYAARRAARAHSRLGAVVADTWRQVPVLSGVIALATCVFAPRNGPEIARVLVPDGALLVVTPAAEHLGELVERLGLLRVDARKQQRLAGALEPHLELVGRTPLSWKLSLSHGDAEALVAMGPSAHHLDPAGLKAEITSLGEPVSTTASVVVSVYRRARPDGA
ncbi:MAG TPA: 23S rRNA methyltransferase [Actinomycetota bacterium]|nr:23S rRNA methyltransferase [Actinomycetota bacterium]